MDAIHERMSTMKKISAIIALSLTLFLTACNSATLVDFIGDESSDTDFGGCVIHFYLENDTENTTQIAYQDNTPQAEALLTRIDNIEKEANCTIALDKDTDKGVVELKLMSGNFDADILSYSGSNVLREWAAANLLYPINGFPDVIDITDAKKYGSLNVLEAAMIDAVPYAVSPVQWPGYQPAECYVMVYNEEMMKENGLTDLHEYYENKTWTWDTFENEFVAPTNIQNEEGLLPVLQTDEPDFYQCVVYSNDVQFIKKEADGTYVADPCPDSFVKAIEWGQNLIKNYGDKILSNTDSYALEEYLSGKALSAFAITSQATVGRIAYNELGNFTSRIMPLPCGPNCEYGKWGQCLQRLYGFGIPYCSSNPDVAAYVISKLCDPFEEFGGENGLFDYYKRQVFGDEIDTEIYFALADNVKYDYTYQCGREIGEFFGDVMVYSRKSVSEAVDLYKDGMTTMIEKYMLKNYEYIDQNS